MTNEQLEADLNAFDSLAAECDSLRAGLEQARAERDEARAKWQSLDWATGKIDALVAMRSNIFTGEPPYVGWTGIHDALNAEFDEKNEFRAQRDAAYALLREARDKGLIYWEPQTTRGSMAKADMCARIDALVGGSR